jgi:hypothetical protein
MQQPKIHCLARDCFGAEVEVRRVGTTAKFIGARCGQDESVAEDVPRVSEECVLAETLAEGFVRFRELVRT